MVSSSMIGASRQDAVVISGPDAHITLRASKNIEWLSCILGPSASTSVLFPPGEASSIPVVPGAFCIALAGVKAWPASNDSNHIAASDRLRLMLRSLRPRAYAFAPPPNRLLSASAWWSRAKCLVYVLLQRIVGFGFFTMQNAGRTQATPLAVKPPGCGGV